MVSLPNPLDDKRPIFFLIVLAVLVRSGPGYPFIGRLGRFSNLTNNQLDSGELTWIGSTLIQLNLFNMTRLLPALPLMTRYTFEGQILNTITRDKSMKYIKELYCIMKSSVRHFKLKKVKVKIVQERPS